MKASCFVFTACGFIVAGMFGVTDKEKSVMVGESVMLPIDVNQHETVQWYFKDIRIAVINEHPSKSCLYDGEGGIFSGRLAVDYETGSLTITNITTEHDGRYEAELIRSESSGKSQSLNKNYMCDRTKIKRKFRTMGSELKTFSVIVSAKTNEEIEKGKDFENDSVWTLVLIAVGACVAVVLLVFAAVCVIYYRCKRPKKVFFKTDVEKNEEHLLELEEDDASCENPASNPKKIILLL